MTIDLGQANLGYIVLLCGIIFGICLFIVRTKDIQTMKPMIEGIPLIQKDLQDLKVDVSKIEGTMSIIPALMVKIEATEARQNRMEDRILAVERELHKA